MYLSGKSLAVAVSVTNEICVCHGGFTSKGGGDGGGGGVRSELLLLLESWEK